MGLRCNFNLGVALVAACCWSCKARVGTSAQKIALHTQVLMSHLYDPSIRICLGGYGIEITKEHRQIVEEALLTWILPLKELDRSLTSRIHFECISKTSDYLTVRFIADSGRSHAKLWSNHGEWVGDFAQLEIYLIEEAETGQQTIKDLKATLVHEMGHAFGLADLYFENSASGFAENKPRVFESVMGVDLGSSLHEMDTWLIRALFANHFARKVQTGGPPKDRSPREVLRFVNSLRGKTGGEIISPCFLPQYIELYRTLLDMRHHNVLAKIAQLRGKDDQGPVRDGVVLELIFDRSIDAIFKTHSVEVRSDYVRVTVRQNSDLGKDMVEKVTMIRGVRNPTPDQCDIIPEHQIGKLLLEIFKVEPDLEGFFDEL